MSVNDLKEYGRRAAQDPAVRAKAKAIGLQNVKGQADYAKTLGYNFSEADMDALAREIEPKGELSEEQLSRVAGGLVTVVVAGAVAAVCGPYTGPGGPTPGGPGQQGW